MPVLPVRWGSSGTASLVLVLDAFELAAWFRCSKGEVPLIYLIEVSAINNGKVLIWNDIYKEASKRWDFNDSTDIPEYQAIEDMVQLEIEVDAPDARQNRGHDAVILEPVTGGVGFADRRSLPVSDWIPRGHLVIARDAENDIYSIQFYYVKVPGEFFWDILSDTDKIRQRQIQTSAGGIWHQPANDPGDIYHKVDLAGNIAEGNP